MTHRRHRHQFDRCILLTVLREDETVSCLRLLDGRYFELLEGVNTHDHRPVRILLRKWPELTGLAEDFGQDHHRAQWVHLASLLHQSWRVVDKDGWTHTVALCSLKSVALVGLPTTASDGQ